MSLRYSSHGFTIIEVLVSLAITGALLATAATLLNGQTGQTTFQQSLRDIQSKLTDSVENISGGLLPNAQQYTCATDDTSKRPKLNKEAGGGFGANQDCIYLGKAIQVEQGQSRLQIYTVLGNRTTKDTNDKKINVPTFGDALPTPAVSGAVGYDLTETFRPLGGAQLVSAKYSTGSGLAEAAMAGFYNDPEGADVSSGQLLSKTYPLPASGASASRVTDCVEDLAANGCTSTPLTKWLLCYQDSSGSRKAYLEITPGSNGIATQLRFQDCPSA